MRMPTWVRIRRRESIRRTASKTRKNNAVEGKARLLSEQTTVDGMYTEANRCNEVTRRTHSWRLLNRTIVFVEKQQPLVVDVRRRWEVESLGVLSTDGSGCEKWAEETEQLERYRTGIYAVEFWKRRYLVRHRCRWLELLLLGSSGYLYLGQMGKNRRAGEISTYSRRIHGANSLKRAVSGYERLL